MLINNKRYIKKKADEIYGICQLKLTEIHSLAWQLNALIQPGLRLTLGRRRCYSVG